MKKFTIALFSIVIVLLAFFIWQSTTKEKDLSLAGLEELTVQLQWFDGAQFCGLYVAKEKRFFEDEGLKVKLVPLNSFTSDPIEILNNGNVDIALATGDQVLINFADGKNIKAFGTVFNRSYACFMYKKGNIKNLTDLVGEKIAVFKKFDTENILKAIALKHNIDINYNNDVLQAGNVDAFISNEVDLYGSYIINEPIDMALKGVSVEVLDPEDYGIEFYSDTYISTTEYWKANRKSLKKFLKAATRGWKYAKNYPEEAIKIMFQNIKNKTKDEHYKKELASLQEATKYLGAGSHDYLFYMEKSRWDKMEQSLFDIKRLSNKDYVNKLCDFDIVSEINE